jgi:hypothetical protein
MEEFQKQITNYPYDTVAEPYFEDIQYDNVITDSDYMNSILLEDFEPVELKGKLPKLVNHDFLDKDQNKIDLTHLIMENVRLKEIHHSLKLKNREKRYILHNTVFRKNILKSEVSSLIPELILKEKNSLFFHLTILSDYLKELNTAFGTMKSSSCDSTPSLHTYKKLQLLKSLEDLSG